MSILRASVMPSISFVHPVFFTRQTFYMMPIAPFRGPNDILSSPLGQHIFDYKPPRGFVIPTFSMFDGSADPYDHMFHYNQAMILNADNDRLLCNVFSTSLQGPAIAWFHKLLRNLINSFSELYAAFVSQYLCLV